MLQRQRKDASKTAQRPSHGHAHPFSYRFLLTSPDSIPVMRAKRAQVAAKGYAGFLLQ
jgi:hypothetical protein